MIERMTQVASTRRHTGSVALLVIQGLRRKPTQVKTRYAS